MNNHTRLQIHKEALNILEAIIHKEELIAQYAADISYMEKQSSYLFDAEIEVHKRTMKLYQRWLGFANRNYTVISSKICGLVELKPTMSKNFKNCNFIDFRKPWM